MNRTLVKNRLEGVTGGQFTILEYREKNSKFPGEWLVCLEICQHLLTEKSLRTNSQVAGFLGILDRQLLIVIHRSGDRQRRNA